MSCSVLVVEDDRSFRQLAVRILGSWGHQVVGEAGTVAEAVARAGELRPDAVLADIGLPDGDGFALTHALLALPSPPRVVLISSDSDVANGPAAERAGACGFVPKDDLASTLLRRLLETGQANDPAGRLRVVIGEDDVLLREGIARLLTDAGIEVVAQAGDADDLLRKALAHKPQVAIVDVQMPPRHEDDGLVAAMELRRRLPQIGVLVLSQFYETSYALELIGDRAEGVGYLLKERVGDVAAFVDAIGRVAAGGSALDPEVVRRMLGRSRPDDPLEVLTPRERAVLGVMAEGKSNSGIADALTISGAAVEKHVTAIFRKLGLAAETTEHRRVHAVLTYVRSTGSRR